MFTLGLIATILVGLLILGLTPVVIKAGLVDRPDGVRKLHESPVPLVGGLAIFVATVLLMIVMLFKSNVFIGGELGQSEIFGWMIGGAILIIGGLLDDKFNLRARSAVIAPTLAALVAALAGIGFSKLTNPLGGFVVIPSIIGSTITFVWLMGSMYTVKLLDGADGLAGTVAGLAVATIGALSLTDKYYQLDVATWCAIVLGAIIGFLLFNWPRAKVYLGEGGGTFLGFTLGVLAVAGGSKIATFALAMGLPMIDVALVLLRRARDGKPLFMGDRRHLHHMLIDSGVGNWGLLARYAAVSLLFGASALLLPSFWKVIALIVLATFSALWIFSLERRVKSS